MHCRWMWVQIKKYRPGPEWLRLSSHGALLVLPWPWLSQLITFALVSTWPTWSCNLSLAEPSFFPCFLPSSPLIIGKVMVFAQLPPHSMGFMPSGYKVAGFQTGWWGSGSPRQEAIDSTGSYLNLYRAETVVSISCLSPFWLYTCLLAEGLADLFTLT